MTQVWQKLGRVYCAKGDAPWRMSHAYIPTALILSESTIRVFVAFWDAWKVGRIGYVDVDAANPTQVLGISKRPSLDIGRPGTFDEHGVSPLSLVEVGSDLYLYYAGWQRSESVRYFLFTGLAKSTDRGESFIRFSEAPILDRSDSELIVRTGGFVFAHRKEWIFAYMGGSNQVTVAGKPTPTYDLMTLLSDSLTEWRGRARIALSPNRPAEFGFGRPWVISEHGRYRMWLSVRSAASGYSITYAESANGLSWERLDDVLQFSGKQEAWDSETRSFASVVDTRAGRFMFYNGNNYGATGFGVAKLVKDEFMESG